MLKPIRLKAVFSIEINRNLYEEIRIQESWDENGKAAHSDRYEEGFIWSELYGQCNEEPFDKWAYNYDMSFFGGTGTIESFFENHFSQEKIRRKGLVYLYPKEDFTGSQEDYWKTDTRISWLYYKRSFDAVFPVLCEHGKTHLEMKLEGNLDDGRQIGFRYTTGDVGEIILDGKHLVNISFYDEKYSGRNFPQALALGRPEELNNGKWAATLYGAYSFSQLMEGIELAAERVSCDEKKAAAGKESIYRVSTLFGKDLLAKRTNLSKEKLIRMGAEKLTVPEIEGRQVGLFYWNYDTSVKTLGGYCEQAFYPDTYRLQISTSDGEEGDLGQEYGSEDREYEYYMAFDELTDLCGRYPLDRFIWGCDPKPADVSDLRKIVLDVLP
ncbi:MAG: hypothetical protein K6F00_06455 [Lachnospiraceae bacterium]|nr:hypothetical protein [Lachnospiraceae bacterium]